MPDAPDDLTDDLTEDQRVWLLHSEALWRQAYVIVSERPDLDAGDVYHSLRSQELSPSERLRRGLARGRLGANRG